MVASAVKLWLVVEQLEPKHPAKGLFVTLYATGQPVRSEVETAVLGHP
jgi:hypothetical protein